MRRRAIEVLYRDACEAWKSGQLARYNGKREWTLDEGMYREPPTHYAQRAGFNAAKVHQDGGPRPPDLLPPSVWSLVLAEAQRP